MLTYMLRQLFTTLVPYTPAFRVALPYWCHDGYRSDPELVEAGPVLIVPGAPAPKLGRFSMDYRRLF